MQKIVSHYLLTNQLYRFHWLAMENGQFISVAPLNGEEAGIEFYNGLLWVLPASITTGELPWVLWAKHSPSSTLKELIEGEVHGYEFSVGERVVVYHFPNLQLPASELSTNNGGGNSYVQRF